MLSLQDILMRRTQEIASSMTAAEEAIERNKQSRRAIEQERKQLNTEISKVRSESRDSRQKTTTIESELEALQAQLDELEQKRQELVETIIEVQQKCEEAQRSSKAFELRLKENENETRKLEREAGKLDYELQELNRRIDDLKVAMLKETRSSFSEYAKGQESQLIKLMEIAPEVEIAKKAYAELMRVKDEDREVGVLWEARNEWKRILETSQVPLIQEKAKREIGEIEGELEKRFPKALMVEKIEERESIILELYYYREGSDPLVAFLPVSLGTWESIERGETGIKEELAAYIFWGLGGREIQDYEILYGYPAMMMAELPEDNVLRLEFTNGKKAEFIIKELPDLFVEAMIDER